MFQTKATITGFIGAIALAVALFSPAKEVTSAESLVGFASGEHVTIHTEQSNKGLLALLLVATVGSAAWTVIGNEEAAPEPVAYRPVVAGDSLGRLRHRTPTPTQPQAAPPTIAGDTLADFWAQDVAFSLLAQQFDLETRRALFRDALIAHEGGWILRLLRWPVLLVIGRPGSAKSSFAAALGITREILNPAIGLTVVTDPNAHLKLSEGIWQGHWQLKGARDNWGEIGGAISDMYRRFADSVAANNVSSIYDEVTTYKNNVNADQLGGFLSQATSKARACAEFITIVAHNDTLKALGGEAGEARLKDDMAQLNLGSKATAIGEMIPTGKGAIEGLDVDEKNSPISQPISLPRWFDPDFLRVLFPEFYGGNEGVSEAVTGRYQVVPVTASLPACNRPETDGRKPVTARAARISAAVHLSSRIYNDLEILVETSTLLAAAEALTEGKSDSFIVKEILECKGRHYTPGKAALELIKQTFTNLED
ncbi:MAG: hypothetical protein ACR2FS_17905 [Phormidesmis sp.]